jgi:allatostatin receptor
VSGGGCFILSLIFYRADELEINHAFRSTVVAFNPLMRSTTNILIINLAISDLMFVIMCIPFTASDYILTNW